MGKMISHKEIEAYISVRIICGGITIYCSQYATREDNYIAARNAVAAALNMEVSDLDEWIKQDDNIEVDYFAS